MGGRKLQTTDKLRQTTPIATIHPKATSNPQKSQIGEWYGASEELPQKKGPHGTTQNNYKKQVERHQYARAERDKRHRQSEKHYMDEHNRGRPPVRQQAKRVVGSPMKDRKSKDQTNRTMDTEWTQATQSPRRHQARTKTTDEHPLHTVTTHRRRINSKKQ